MARSILPKAIVSHELPDIIAGHLKVLFCGINPGMSAAAAGHHFVGRNNRFWRVIHLAGFTPEEIEPQEDRTILKYGYGLTTVVQRPTARADQLSPAEFTAAAAGFQRKVPWGLQPDRMAGAAVWVLPNPSGRNLAFTLDRLVEAYRELYRTVEGQMQL